MSPNSGRANTNLPFTSPVDGTFGYCPLLLPFSGSERGNPTDIAEKKKKVVIYFTHDFVFQVIRGPYLHKYVIGILHPPYSLMKEAGHVAKIC